jgi:hypothetical protein
MDRWIKAAHLASALLAGAAALHYFVVFLPSREKARDAADPKPVATARLPEADHCRQAAHLLHDIHWAAACMSVSQEAEERHAACIRDIAMVPDPRMTRGECERMHPRVDGSIDCTLPVSRAARINAMLVESEDRCRGEGGLTARRK